MKAIFGVVSLLIALAAVGWLAKTQLHALRAGGVADSPAGTGQPAGSTTATGSAQARQLQLQQQIVDDTASALQQGADRNASAAAQ